MEEDGQTAAPVAGDMIDEASENERQVQFHAHEAQRLMVLANQATQKISESEQTVLKYAIRAGTHLLAAKQLLPHGRWQKWVKAHFEASVRTARIYMRIAKHYGPPGKVAVDGIQSIQTAVNAIAKCERDLGPREVIGLNEWMQHAKRAKHQLGQSVKDAFIRSIDDEVAVCLWCGPGRAVWDQLLEKTMSSFVKEARRQMGNSYEDWHTRLLQERAVERVEHCHRMIEECENHKDSLSEEIEDARQRVVDENDVNRRDSENNHVLRLEGELENVNHAINVWGNTLVDAERHLEGQRTQARKAPKQEMEANDDTPPSSQSHIHQPVNIYDERPTCQMPVTT